MCEEIQTFTFFGDIKKNIDLHKYVKKNYLKSSTLIYKEDSKENYLVVCKNQTCSDKIKTLGFGFEWDIRRGIEEMKTIFSALYCNK